MSEAAESSDAMPEISPIHAQSMASHLWMLYKSKLGTDVQVRCGEQTYDLHSSVLSHGSNYFQNALKEKKTMIELDFPSNNINSNTFDIILESLYTGIVTGLDEDNVTLVLGASFDLKVMHVVEACANFMVDRLDIDNCLEYWLAAKMCSLHELRTQSIGLIGRHLQSISKTQFFMQLHENTLKEILNDDNLQVPSEHWVYEAAISWIKYDKESRKGNLNSVLETIRLSQLPVQFLIKVVGKEDLIENDHSAMVKYSHALKCKLDCRAQKESHTQIGIPDKSCKARHGFSHFLKGSFERLTNESKTKKVDSSSCLKLPNNNVNEEVGNFDQSKSFISYRSETLDGLSDGCSENILYETEVPNGLIAKRGQNGNEASENIKEILVYNEFEK